MRISQIGKGLAAACAISLTLSIVPTAVQAQEAAQAEELTWAEVSMTRFLPGKRDRAIEIIKNYYAKADQMAGRVLVSTASTSTPANGTSSMSSR